MVDCSVTARTSLPPLLMGPLHTGRVISPLRSVHMLCTLEHGTAEFFFKLRI